MNINLIISTAKIEKFLFFIFGVHKLTYTTLNILRDLTNLEKLDISLDFSACNELLAARSDNVCLNIGLRGVLELLRTCKWLKKILFQNVVTYGKHLPSHYIKQKLNDQQDNFQLRKYIVKVEYPWRSKENEMLFKSDLVIINKHYI